MEEGKELGYTPREIRAGVIKAMKAGSEIRRYFERKVDRLDQEGFMEMLELWYTKKESSDLMDVMAESVQGPSETEKKYLMKMFELRDHIMEVTEKEEEPLGSAYVQKKMIRAIGVGFRRDVVRLEMINVLKDPKISDGRLMKELNVIVARDEENRKKMAKNGGKAKVNLLQDHTGGGGRSRSQDSERKETLKDHPQSLQLNDHPQSFQAISRIETQLGQLSVTMSELAAGKSDVEERLKKLENKLLAGNGGSGSGRRNVIKCEDCERNKKFCTHCSKCGESGHKFKECPKN